MYNRYVPQQDGTYQKNRIQNAPSAPHHPPPTPPPPPCEEEKPPYQQPQGAFDFLKQLLPSNLDTGDLLIIILLLLMAGDCKENKNSWLLTLALYLFL